MSEYKCCASVYGICRNIYGFGAKCNGYSKECKLRPAYRNVQTAAENAAKTLRNAFGIKGDCE